jgi:hypothetical protein
LAADSTQHRLAGSGAGSEWAHARGPDLVIEWYDFGAHAPYESANLLILGPDGQAALAAAMGVEGDAPDALAAAVAVRFISWFEVRSYLTTWKIPARRETDFMP